MSSPHGCWDPDSSPTANAPNCGAIFQVPRSSIFKWLLFISQQTHHSLWRSEDSSKQPVFLLSRGDLESKCECIRRASKRLSPELFSQLGSCMYEFCDLYKIGWVCRAWPRLDLPGAHRDPSLSGPSQLVATLPLSSPKGPICVQTWGHLTVLYTFGTKNLP